MNRPWSVNEYSDSCTSRARGSTAAGIPYRCDDVRGAVFGDVRDQLKTSVPHFSMHTMKCTLE